MHICQEINRCNSQVCSHRERHPENGWCDYPCDPERGEIGIAGATCIDVAKIEDSPTRQSETIGSKASVGRVN